MFSQGLKLDKTVPNLKIEELNRYWKGIGTDIRMRIITFIISRKIYGSLQDTRSVHCRLNWKCC